MYIPRPAKLLFTVDDGLDKPGESVSPCTRPCAERMPGATWSSWMALAMMQKSTRRDEVMSATRLAWPSV
ncbi:hypothetical protein ACUZIT_004364 [Enterobacter hormaechei]